MKEQPLSVMNASHPRGSLWNRWDLHFHTPASYDYQDKSITDEKIIDTLVEQGIRAVAITDHHTMDVGRIANLQKIAKNRVTVFPGIELRSDQASPSIHYIAIFPETSDLSELWKKIEVVLCITKSDLEKRGGDDGIFVPIIKALPAIREAGGIITVHAGGKSNSLEQISNDKKFKQKIKEDILVNYADIIEIGRVSDAADYENIVFPAIKYSLPIIICSDNHKATEYTAKASLWIKADPTFRGLLMAIREPENRVFIGDQPPSHSRIGDNRTKYIRRISFRRTSEARDTEKWFEGSVSFNSGLIAIIGNKGNGKSALADTIGLLGGSSSSQHFSFLNKKRFRHSKNKLASLFEAEIEWESSELFATCLNDDVSEDALETVKYLPQEHVERICNELELSGDNGFEDELKSVIFSHIADADKLDCITLSELIDLKTGEKQKRIDSLLKQLKEACRTRETLETQAAPATRRDIEAKIELREKELKSLDEARPAAVAKPESNAPQSDEEKVIANTLLENGRKADALKGQITAEQVKIKAATRRKAIASRLNEKLTNFEKDYAQVKLDLSDDAKELEISIDSLISLTISTAKPIQIKDQATTEIDTATTALKATNPVGLEAQDFNLRKENEDLKKRLDAPNRAHQASIKLQADWEEKRNHIIGTSKISDSLTELKTRLATLNGLPALIQGAVEKQIGIAKQIFQEKSSQAQIYRDLYGSVQDFIDKHSAVNQKLGLEFRVAIHESGVTNDLMAKLALNRKGSFMGRDEAATRIGSLSEETDWSDVDSTIQFLDSIEDALRFDRRDGGDVASELLTQIAKGTTAADFFTYLYGLEYLKPRYILRWQEKELSMLSPGERGTLLLIFYLLIDKSDIPLIIDQPEGNLDNQTVAKVLVDCIREAKNRRQVFIVTHNPNLAVVCDADQVIYSSMDKNNGNAISYTSGSLENPEITQYVTDVLEGTLWAFRVRDQKYLVGAE